MVSNLWTFAQILKLHTIESKVKKVLFQKKIEGCLEIHLDSNNYCWVIIVYIDQRNPPFFMN